MLTQVLLVGGPEVQHRAGKPRRVPELAYPPVGVTLSMTTPWPGTGLRSRVA